MGRASKQTYVGKVIYPATYRQGSKGGKPFITFTLYVDNLAFNPQSKNRESGKIQCTYTIKDETDPVGIILCNVHDSKNPEGGGLAGQQYKTVLVWVEGSERLTMVMNQDGTPVPGAVYKNLEYCSVQVLDTQVLGLYRAATGQSEGGQEQAAPVEQQGPQFHQPTVAPMTQQAPQNFLQQPQVSPQQVAPTMNQQVSTGMPMMQPTATTAQHGGQMPTSGLVRNQPRQAPARTQYQPGDRLADPTGRVLEFRGGDPSNIANWQPVAEEPVATQAPRKTPIKDLLDPEDQYADSPLMQNPRVTF